MRLIALKNLLIRGLGCAPGPTKKHYPADDQYEADYEPCPRAVFLRALSAAIAGGPTDHPRSAAIEVGDVEERQPQSRNHSNGTLAVSAPFEESQQPCGREWQNEKPDCHSSENANCERGTDNGPCQETPPRGLVLVHRNFNSLVSMRDSFSWPKQESPSRKFP